MSKSFSIHANNLTGKELIEACHLFYQHAVPADIDRLEVDESLSVGDLTLQRHE